MPVYLEYIYVRKTITNLIFRSKLAQLKAEQLGRTGNKSSEEEEAAVPGPSRVEVGNIEVLFRISGQLDF